MLETQLKWTNNGTSRIIPVEETLKKVSKIIKKIGITRISDITYMDKLYIPNYSAVLPGTDDYIWVYSGKGPTKKHAKASAVMESIERYSALPNFYKKKFIQGTHNELSKSHKILHPNEIIEPTSIQYSNEMIMDYVEGYDLINQETILVPSTLSLFRYTPSYPSINPFAFHHTNGLASGNVIEEAICHALCEVIERDAISLAQLQTSAIPYHILHNIILNLKRNNLNIQNIHKEKFVDDNSIFPDVELSDLEYEPVRKLIKKFDKFHIPLSIKNITSDIGIPTFNVGCVEWISENYGYLAEGHGTHPDKRIALMRAITEVSQTRTANIHGARDDLRKINYGDNNSDDKNSWQFMQSKDKIKFSEINTYTNNNILDDIKLILNNLKKAGLQKAIVIDLTNDEIKIPVVRVIVPGMETFKISKSVIGNRARRFFKRQNQ
ncbi:MAG: YcaO-like family protein [Nitrososphaeraceae archaeon]